jgi:hypothetical protein
MGGASGTGTRPTESQPPSSFFQQLRIIQLSNLQLENSEPGTIGCGGAVQPGMELADCSGGIVACPPIKPIQLFESLRVKSFHIAARYLPVQASWTLPAADRPAAARNLPTCQQQTCALLQRVVVQIIPEVTAI